MIASSRTDRSTDEPNPAIVGDIALNTDDELVGMTYWRIDDGMPLGCATPLAGRTTFFSEFFSEIDQALSSFGKPLMSDRTPVVAMGPMISLVRKCGWNVWCPKVTLHLHSEIRRYANDLIIHYVDKQQILDLHQLSDTDRHIFAPFDPDLDAPEVPDGTMALRWMSKPGERRLP